MFGTWMKWFRKRRAFGYHIKIFGSRCYLTFFGPWDEEEAPPVMNRALRKLKDQDWLSLHVDCCRVTPTSQTVLRTSFVSCMIEMVKLAEEQARRYGRISDWTFRFRKREHTVKILDTCRLEGFFRDHVIYEKKSGRLGLGSQIVLRSEPTQFRRTDTDNDTA